MRSEISFIDLRSDTVTRPTPEMRRAMAEAEVGDDVYGEDPTVNRLQETAADMLGFEAALFVPTGSMGNQVALAVHTRPGEEVVCDADSHILHYEMAAMAALSGLLPRVLRTADGFPDAQQVTDAIQPDIGYLARTGLVSLENSHNRGGGAVMEVEKQREVQKAAHSKGVPVHLDGARIFNAAAALGVDVREVAKGFDSVMFCLSKGLGAPVGSLLCGSTDFIKEARRVRKRFGGGMRQAGVLAAPGLIALERMTGRLIEDHDRARRIAGALVRLPGIQFASMPRTNILVFTVGPEWFEDEMPEDGNFAGRFVAHLKENGILALALDKNKVRMVTHYDLPEDVVERTIMAVSRV
ncbi:MAG: low specificity L-threonine aldolase [bacterium]|nr:MAG: low specificity L-threonine aldolase [bacterium]